jgi:hypothetical protein
LTNNFTLCILYKFQWSSDQHHCHTSYSNLNQSVCEWGPCWYDSVIAFTYLRPKDTALTAVTDRAVLWQTNQELLEKQQQQQKKKSWKGVENARVLTVNEGRAIMQKEEDRAKELAIKSARYHALRVKLNLRSWFERKWPWTIQFSCN